MSIPAEYELCTKGKDNFVMDKCVWIIELKDGTRVFQDDNRPGAKEPSAWKRLDAYIRDNPENKIHRMFLKFGTHLVEMPQEQPFYYYSRAIIQHTGMDDGLHFHVVGCLNDNGDVECLWYKIPELIVADERLKKISDCRPEQLIGDLTGC